MSLRVYIVKRAINTLILLFFVITLNFVIFELMPGTQGSIETLASSGKLRTQEQYEKLLNMYNFCKKFENGVCTPNSALDRYVPYVKNMLTFQFGISYQTGHDVMEDMVQSHRLENTLVLIGVSTVLSTVLGVILGVGAAYWRGRPFDTVNVTSSLIFYSLPVFWLGVMLLFIFFNTLHMFPGAGVTPADWSVLGTPDLLTQILVRLRHLFLPALTLTIISYGGFLLLTRATMLEVLNEDYIVTARAKGISERSVLFKHALKNASLPIVTATALSIGFILTGALITETVFSWKGLGLWTWQSIGWKDFPVLQAMFYIVALMVIFTNFASDLIYGMIDPRVKYE